MPESFTLLIRDAGLSYPSALTGVVLTGHAVAGHELIKLSHFAVRDTGENPAQPSLRIDLVHAAGFNERAGDGSSSTAC